MPELIFRLRGVPDDEAEEVRALLDEHGIRYYETDAGNWKISVPALWLPDRQQLEAARKLLSDYQARRFEAVHGDYEARVRAGKAPRMLDRVRESPLRFLVYIAGVAVIIYLSVMPFIDIASW